MSGGKGASLRDRAAAADAVEPVVSSKASIPSASLKLMMGALTRTERDALIFLWTTSRKAVHRLALMGFVDEWSHFTGMNSFKLKRTERGDFLASAIEAGTAETPQSGSVEDESAK